MSTWKKRTILLVSGLLLTAAFLFMGPKSTEASQYYYFKEPTANASVTAGNKINISFYAGVVVSKTECDDWGRPSTTTYETMPVTLKIYKGSTLLATQNFTYTRGTTIETTYTPSATGTLTLKLFGRNVGLNVTEQSLQDTISIKVKKRKASAAKTVKPVIVVERTAKTAVKITCTNDCGYGMKIYRATKKNGKYTLIKTTSKATFTDKKVSAKKVYFYKIRLFAKSGKKEYLSKWSVKVKAEKYVSGKITLSYSASKGVKVSWKEISGAGYYLVARSTTGSGEYDVISCEDATTTTYYDKDVVKGKTYYYAIIAEDESSQGVGKYMDKKYKIKIA